MLVADSGEQYDSAGMTPAVRARVSAQEPVLRVADDFANLRSDGFSGSRIDTPGQSVTVYWHGPLPDEAQALIEQTRSSAIALTIKAAPFSKATLRQTEQRILSVRRQIRLTFS